MTILQTLFIIIITVALLAIGFFAARMTLPTNTTCFGQMPILEDK